MNFRVPACAGTNGAWLEPPLLHDHGIAGAHRIRERHLALELLAGDVAGDLDIAMTSARRKTAGNRDRLLHRHVGDVRMLAGLGDLAQDEERPVGLDLDRHMRLAHETLLEPLGDACLLYTSPSPRDRQKSRMP